MCEAVFCFVSDANGIGVYGESAECKCQSLKALAILFYLLDILSSIISSSFVYRYVFISVS